MRYDESPRARSCPLPSLQIRELPEDLYQALSLRAQEQGRSLAQQALYELRRLPELTAAARRRATLAKIRERVAREGTRDLKPTPEELIREDRNR